MKEATYDYFGSQVPRSVFEVDNLRADQVAHAVADYFRILVNGYVVFGDWL